MSAIKVEGDGITPSPAEANAGSAPLSSGMALHVPGARRRGEQALEASPYVFMTLTRTLTVLAGDAHG